MGKMRIASVAYANSIPYVDGLRSDPIQVRSICAWRSLLKLLNLLKNDEIDIGLMPVAGMDEIEGSRIVSSYGIGCDGKVDTVCIFSDRPIDEVESIFMDFHSRTSVELAKILLERHWRVSPEVLRAEEGFLDQIGGERAGLVIGDRAISLIGKYKYSYDLGEAWKEMTGDSFVFAAWIAKNEISPEFLSEFEDALKSGIEKIADLDLPEYHNFDVRNYLENTIKYRIDTAVVEKFRDLRLSTGLKEG